MIVCPFCGHQHQFSSDVSGRQVECQSCQRLFLAVPSDAAQGPDLYGQQPMQPRPQQQPPQNPAAWQQMSSWQTGAPPPHSGFDQSWPPPQISNPSKTPKKPKRGLLSRSPALTALGAVAGLLFLCCGGGYWTISNMLGSRMPEGAPNEPFPVARAELPRFPELPPGAAVIGGRLHQVRLQGSGPGESMQLWVYLPTAAAQGGRVPCVMIAPAGSPLVTGMALSAGDRPEHTPYVQAGYAAHKDSGAAFIGPAVRPWPR